MLGRLRQQKDGDKTAWEELEWKDPNVTNLVAEGSTTDILD
jgi:hypothetical protein